MYNYTVSFIAGLIAMGFVVSSYFFASKSLYLLFQSIGIVFLITSYFFIEEFFAMVGLVVGLGRTLAYFFYSKREKRAPLFCAVTFSVLTISVYVIINIGILGTAKLVDLINLTALVFYACVYRVQDLKKLRYLLFVPLSLCVLCNVLIGATPFVIVSYSFEFGANVLSIVKNYWLHKTPEIEEVNQTH